MWCEEKEKERTKREEAEGTTNHCLSDSLLSFVSFLLSHFTLPILFLFLLVLNDTSSRFCFIFCFFLLLLLF